MNATETPVVIPDKEVDSLIKTYYQNKASESANASQYYMQNTVTSNSAYPANVNDYYLGKDNKLLPLGPNFTPEENQTYANFLAAVAKNKLPPPGKEPSNPPNTISESLTNNATSNEQKIEVNKDQSSYDVPVPQKTETSPASAVYPILDSEDAAKFDNRQNKSTESIVHEVTPTDTLEGIVIKYGVSKDAIRMANDFLGEEVWMKKTLIIPRTKGPLYQYVDPRDYNEVQKLYAIDMLIIWIKAKYKDQKNISSEAKYYLELHNYDLKAAFKEFEDDIEFEKQAYKNQKPFIKPEKSKKVENKKINNYESGALLYKKKQ